jgi:hypothetical protein
MYNPLKKENQQQQELNLHYLSEFGLMGFSTETTVA